MRKGMKNTILIMLNLFIIMEAAAQLLCAIGRSIEIVRSETKKEDKDVK